MGRPRSLRPQLRRDSLDGSGTHIPQMFDLDIAFLVAIGLAVLGRLLIWRAFRGLSAEDRVRLVEAFARRRGVGLVLMFALLAAYILSTRRWPDAMESLTAGFLHPLHRSRRHRLAGYVASDRLASTPGSLHPPIPRGTGLERRCNCSTSPGGLLVRSLRELPSN